MAPTGPMGRKREKESVVVGCSSKQGLISFYIRVVNANHCFVYRAATVHLYYSKVATQVDYIHKAMK